MKIFQCSQCANPIFFENTKCEKCGAALGYLSEQQQLTSLVASDNFWQIPEKPETTYQYCANHTYDVCNWLIPVDSENPFCQACRLNRTIPDLNNLDHLTAWQKLEYAKHRLIYSLLALKLDLENQNSASEVSLCFDFLADEDTDTAEKVLTGHNSGVVTLNIAEANSIYREHERALNIEPYRTLIGHFRHETGHYFWEQLVQINSEILQNFRQLFGDERVDYQQALDNHYTQTSSADWQLSFISTYAAVHPWEDWAETWAHYLHIIDTLETAYAFGIKLSPNLSKLPSLNRSIDFNPYHEQNFAKIIDRWIPLTLAINSINHSMGQPDLYPFVLPDPVIKKLSFIHKLLHTS